MTLREDPKKSRTRAALQPPLALDTKGFGSAGQSLVEEKYDDLDEVVARFVEPLVARCREVRGGGLGGRCSGRGGPGGFEGGLDELLI